MIKEAFINANKELRSLWLDTCSISRKEAIVKENGANGFADVTVYMDIPCHYSQKAIDSNQTKQTHDTEYTHTLYLGNEIDVHMGDIITVNIKETGVYNHFRASEPISRFSHKQVNLTREKKA
jgi:hypothetical protein